MTPPPLTISCAADYQRSQEFCRQLTRKQARNFYYGLRLLPEPTRSSMFALYAWMRRADDLADDSTSLPLTQRYELLGQFRSLTHQAIAGTAASSSDNTSWPGWTAFTECVHRHNIPTELFDAMIDGQKQDLDFHQPETDADLRDYCYRVAGVVGVASIHIWGYTGGTQTETLAVDRGMAFQLTNILRDIREDADRLRIYFPRERMRHAGATEADLIAGKYTTGVQALIKYHLDLAEELFSRSAPLEQQILVENISALRAMTAIYHGLLRKIAQNPQRVLHGRVRLGKLAKTWIALQCRRGGGR